MEWVFGCNDQCCAGVFFKDVLNQLLPLFGSHGRTDERQDQKLGIIDDRPGNQQPVALFFRKNMVSVVVTRRRISVPKDFIQTSLYFGCFIRWRYSRSFPVSSSRMADAASCKNLRGKRRDAACCAVKGERCASTSKAVSMWSWVIIPRRWFLVLAEGGES